MPEENKELNGLLKKIESDITSGKYKHDKQLTDARITDAELQILYKTREAICEALHRLEKAQEAK